jgi:predicted PurR-regulated permease PerM
MDAMTALPRAAQRIADWLAGWLAALKVSAASLAITSLEGWLLTPVLMGKVERMHVLVVFLGVLVWTWLWGARGTVLAVPMLVVFKAICDHVEPLAPIGRLLAR